MTNLGPLFDTPRARNTDPAPSHLAARKVTPRAGTLAARVVESLREHGPATTHELAARMGESLVTVSPRIKPLVVRGLVEAGGTDDHGRTIWREVKDVTCNPT